MSDTAEQPEPLTETMREFCAAMRISERHGYEMARKGELQTIRFGRAIRIPRTERQRLLKEVEAPK